MTDPTGEAPDDRGDQPAPVAAPRPGRPPQMVTFGAHRLPRQFSVRLVLTRARDTFRTAPWLIVRLAVIVFLPIAVLDAAVVELGEHLAAADTVSFGIRAGAEILDLVVDVLGYALFGGLLDHLVGEIHHGHEAHRPHEVARRMSYGRLFVAVILFNVVVVAGVVACIVPGLIAFTLFICAGPIINIERRSVLDAFRRSFQITRRYPLGVAITVTLPFVVEQVVDSVVEAAAHGFWAEVAADFVLALVATTPVVLLEVCTAYHLLELESERTGEPGPSPAH